MSYATDRRWSDLMLPQIKQLVGPLLLEAAPLEFDQRQSTDLMVLRARDMRIAARVRRPGYEKYRHEFTIRMSRDTGAETELSKIVNGWGDWLFYGHADEFDFISIWWVIDLHSFRAALIRNSMNGKPLEYADKHNGDGTSFRAFDLRSFPPKPPILIGSSEDLPKLYIASSQNRAEAGNHDPWEQAGGHRQD